MSAISRAGEQDVKQHTCRKNTTETRGKSDVRFKTLNIDFLLTGGAHMQSISKHQKMLHIPASLHASSIIQEAGVEHYK